MAEVKLNLWQRINAVMKDVEYLNKDDKVSTGGTNSYKAISEEKVTTVVGAALRKHGIVILPIEQEHIRQDEVVKDQYGKEKTNRLTTINVKYKMVNIDNPEEFEVLTSSGTGIDTQDKGVGKAMTYAYKYLLLRTFSIATGDDPDKVASDDDNSPAESKQAANVNGPATKKDISSVLEAAKAKNIDNEKLKEIMTTVLKKDTMKGILKSEVDKLLERLEAIK